MGMFDNELGKPFAESGVKEGEPFTLQAAKMGPTINTKFGLKDTAKLTIDGTDYTAFGAGLVNQVRSMDDGDLPAVVVLRFKPTNKGNPMPLLYPVNAVPDDVLPVGTAKADNGDDIPF